MQEEKMFFFFFCKIRNWWCKTRKLAFLFIASKCYIIFISHIRTNNIIERFAKQLAGKMRRPGAVRMALQVRFYITRCHNATLPFEKFRNIRETWQTCKKKRVHRRQKIQKAAGRKITGNAYRMNRNNIIIIVLSAVTVIARIYWIMTFFLYLSHKMLLFHSWHTMVADVVEVWNACRAKNYILFLSSGEVKEGTFVSHITFYICTEITWSLLSKLQLE